MARYVDKIPKQIEGKVHDILTAKDDKKMKAIWRSWCFALCMSKEPSP